MQGWRHFGWSAAREVGELASEQAGERAPLGSAGAANLGLHLERAGARPRRRRRRRRKRNWAAAGASAVSRRLGPNEGGKKSANIFGAHLCMRAPGCDCNQLEAKFLFNFTFFALAPQANAAQVAPVSVLMNIQKEVIAVGV